MEFIAENYIWFIIGGIVILMAVVGYIADITDFGRKKFDSQVKEKTEKVKKEKVKKVKEKKEKIVEELPLEQTDNVETNVFNELEMPTLPLEQPETFENNGEQLESFENNSEQLESFESTEDANLFVNEPVEEQAEEQVDQSLFEPLPGMEQSFEENVDNVTAEEVQKESEVQSDDDIWKF